MSVSVRSGIDSAASARPDRGDTDKPIRPGTWHRDDALVLGGAANSSLALVWLIYDGLTPLAGPVGFAIWWLLAFLAMYWFAVRRLEGSLMAKDRVMSVLITVGAGAVLVPLVLVIAYIAYQGVGVITPHFFVQDSNVCSSLDAPTCGGIAHAIVGTLEQVAIAVAISVPLAVLCAVFLNEIGGPLKRPVRLFVDAMSGIPSIVAGLFVYVVWVLGVRHGEFSGSAASLALAILMLPTITRTSEEVLRLVPDGLREGSLALGASEWRTVWNVVLPTARSGLITAVILGVARAVGETAPLILLAFGSAVMNANPFHDPQEALPYYVYKSIQIAIPGSGLYQRGFAAALVLILLVLALFTSARVLGARTSIEGRQRRAAKRASRARAIAGSTEQGAGSRG